MTLRVATALYSGSATLLVQQAADSPTSGYTAVLTSEAKPGPDHRFGHPGGPKGMRKTSFGVSSWVLWWSVP